MREDRSNFPFHDERVRVSPGWSNRCRPGQAWSVSSATGGDRAWGKLPPVLGRIVMKLSHRIILSVIAAGALSTIALAQEMKKEIGAGEGQVDIVAWPGYIERGETDKSYDWVTDFEAKTGCKVNVKTAGTSDEMVALMNEGGFDLVTASGDASLRLVAGKRVQPINIDLVKSWSTVDDRLKDAPWYTVDGVHYGIPYQWGPNVLMYNSSVFKEAPKSWNVVFEEMNLPDGKS